MTADNRPARDQGEAMRKEVDHNHPEARLMGTTVQHEGHNCTVVGLQSGYATISRADGYKRSIPIHTITNRSNRD